MPNKNQNIRNSLSHSWNDLKNIVKSLNNLISGIVIVIALLSATLIWVALSSAGLSMGFTILLVFLVSIAVYIKTNNFGEASLALVAGLLTVFTVDWTQSLFLIFWLTWIGFAIFALIIASIRIAAKTEEIYVDASLALTDDRENSKTIEKRLRKIAKDSPHRNLGPIERAEVIQILSHRKIPIESIGDTLSAIQVLSTVTKVDYKSVAYFFGDIYRVIRERPNNEWQPTLAFIYKTIKESPVHPKEFISSFDETKRLVLAGRLSLLNLLIEIRDALSIGVSPNDMFNYIDQRIEENEAAG